MNMMNMSSIYGIVRAGCQFTKIQIPMKTKTIACLLFCLCLAVRGDGLGSAANPCPKKGLFDSRPCYIGLFVDGKATEPDTPKQEGPPPSRGRVPQLNVRLERYADMSYVQKRFAHSVFQTTMRNAGGNDLYGEDQFNFYWLVGTMQRPFYVLWRFKDEYVVRTGAYGRRDLIMTGLLISVPVGRPLSTESTTHWGT